MKNTNYTRKKKLPARGTNTNKTKGLLENDFSLVLSDNVFLSIYIYDNSIVVFSLPGASMWTALTHQGIMLDWTWGTGPDAVEYQ